MIDLHYFCGVQIDCQERVIRSDAGFAEKENAIHIRRTLREQEAANSRFFGCSEYWHAYLASLSIAASLLGFLSLYAPQGSLCYVDPC
jgi:hypothetical protein